MAFQDGGRSPSDRPRKSVQNLLAGLTDSEVNTLGQCASDMDLSKFHSHGGELSSSESRRGSLEHGHGGRRGSAARLSDVSVDGNLVFPKKFPREDRRRSRIMSQGNVQKLIGQRERSEVD